MILRYLSVQGVAGLAASLCLALLLVLQKGETRHWRKQSGQYEALYRAEQAAFAGTVANYRAAAAAADAADKANAERVAAEQRAINERIANDYETRIAAARAAAERLRRQAQGATHSGSRGTTPLPTLSASAEGADRAAGQDRLPDPDRLIATEQAIQLDELIKWVKSQAEVRSADK